MSKKYLLWLSALVLIVGSPAALAQDKTAGADQGQVQFVSALDAAWVRVVRDGTYQAIINDPANASSVNSEGVGGVLPVDHVIDNADCLPNPDVTIYPGEIGPDSLFVPTPAPTGLLLRVLTTGSVERCVVTGNAVFGDTTDFARASPHLEAAVLAEMADFYCNDALVTFGAVCGGITVTDTVELAPPWFDGTTALNLGQCDYINQVNALGGRSRNVTHPTFNPFVPGQNERRTDVRLHTCMISGSEQFIHIPDSNRPNVDGASKQALKEINSLLDLQNNPDIAIISGNLSTQLVNEYMPDHTVVTVVERDIELGWTGVFETGVCNCRATFSPPACQLLPADNPGGVCPDRILPFFPFTNFGSNFVQPDVIINPNHDLNPGLAQNRQNKLRVVPMNVTAGTPLWVGIKDVP